MNRILWKVEEKEETERTKEGDLCSHNGLVKISPEIMMMTTKIIIHVQWFGCDVR